MLHSECTTSCFMAKSVVWHNFQSSSNKQARQTFHWFVQNSHFIKPSECKYVLFAGLSVRLQVYFIPLHFRYFGWRFSFRTVDLSREIRAVLPTLWFSRKRIKIIFLRSAKINPHIFETKPRKFGNAKISHYTVIIICKQLSCDSVKDNSDLFLSIFIAATAINSLIMKEELRNYCQQMERQNNKRIKYMINRLGYDIFRIIPHINPRPISALGPLALRLIWESRVDMGYDTKNVI